MNRLCAAIALIASAGLAAAGFHYGTYAAGGSDSSCYVLMADAFASGHLQPSSALEPAAPWPDAPKTFVPGGFVPSQFHPAAAAPVCAPGFSLLLAAAMRLGGEKALFAVTPLAGALLVWCAFVAARALAGPPAGPIAGMMAAVLIATSPIVLFQVVQPMNDIITAALWMAVFAALARPERATRVEGWRLTLAGVCCGMALLVRPNLLPLGVIAGIYALAAGGQIPNPESRIPSPGFRVPPHVRSAVRFGIAAAPFVIVIAWLNYVLYGGPLRSGYGQLGNLFSAANISVNAGQYTRWLIQTQTVVIFLGLLVPGAVEKQQRRGAWLALGLVAATLAIYFAYTPFDDWSYLRFLLPAIGLLIVSTSVVVARTGRLIGWRASALLAALLTASLAFNGVAVARDRQTFQLNALEQRYRTAGMAVRDQLPPNAAILATWDSGAVRFHGGKEAVVWDALDPAWLDRALAWLFANGHQPFILVESWEEPRFRARFGGRSSIGNLDWPPKYEVDRQVRIYDPADRARYLSGEQVITQYLWPLRQVREVR